MKVLTPGSVKNPDTGLRVTLAACECPVLDNCAWEFPIDDVGDYGGLSLNGIKVTRDIPPNDDAELLNAINEDLLAAGAIDLVELTYDGNVVKYNASSEKVPDYILVGGEEVEPTKLCDTKEECKYEVKLPFSQANNPVLVINDAEGLEVVNTSVVGDFTTGDQAAADAFAAALLAELPDDATVSVELIDGVLAYLVTFTLPSGYTGKLGEKELRLCYCDTVYYDASSDI